MSHPLSWLHFRSTIYRSNGDALDLVLDILSAGLTPFSAQLPPTSSSSTQMPSSSFSSSSSTSRLPSTTLPPPTVPPSTPSLGDYDTSSPTHRPPVSNQSTRFHTLPHPPTAAGATSSSLLKHQVSSPPPLLNSHSSLPRNFMPQSNYNGGEDLNNGVIPRRHGPPPPPVPVSLPPPHASLSTTSGAQMIVPNSSQSELRINYHPSQFIQHDHQGGEVVAGFNGDRFNAGVDPLAPPFFPTAPPPPSSARGGTWPNSVSRNTSDANASGYASRDSSLSSRGSGGALLDGGNGESVAVHRQKPFENASMEKEYLHYIASVKQYLSNQQQHNNYSDRGQSLPFATSNNFSSKLREFP